MKKVGLPLLIVGLRLLAACTAGENAESPPSAAPVLENVHELVKGVLSGAAPDGERGFGELARLGVRTVISVDGIKPDVEGARKHGLRYVHLPIGYDGVPLDRALELGKALSELPGPIYIHCHHGKHRGPAAAAVACVVAGKLDNDQAARVMREMGTGEQYPGLWFAARIAKAADPKLLKDLKVTFREVAPVPLLAEAMVSLDQALDSLELSRRSRWKTPTENSDITPAHEALRIREVFMEIMRTGDFDGRPPDFKAWMRAGHEAAGALEVLFGADQRSQIVEADVIEKALDALHASCNQCHKTYRNSQLNK